jgi:hypothetical protein
MKVTVLWDAAAAVVWYILTDVSGVLAASIFRAMMTKAVSTSETSVNLYKTTQRNVSEDSGVSRP